MYLIILTILIGTVLISISSSLVGSFALLQRKSLIGDAIAHATLPGVCLSFLLFKEKNPFVLIIGAFITGWLCVLFIDFVSSKTKVKKDAALGIALTSFFGLGIMLLTYLQHLPSMGNVSGLSDFIFGNIVSVTQVDLLAFSIVALVSFGIIMVLYKELLVYSFDEAFAKTIGFPVRTIRIVLSFLTILTVISNIQAIGIVLTASMLITPVAAARFWTNKLKRIFILAIVFSMISSVLGIIISYHFSVPTGPVIVVFLSVIAILSFLFAPEKGVVARRWRQGRIKKRIADENILKSMYKMNEKTGDADLTGKLSISALIERNGVSNKSALRSLRRLKKEEQVNNINELWQLTASGAKQGRRLVKLHRLWEVYLTNKLAIAHDHVHDDAESVEHIITPELEAELEKILGYPEVDPHETKIPY
ncbi:MAG: iron chelate uptake ABC transporter family permease subunit [Cyclobacteriaceae bacterium]